MQSIVVYSQCTTTNFYIICIYVTKKVCYNNSVEIDFRYFGDDDSGTKGEVT